MPREAPPEGVPSLGDPDRKRVLNILAQRRYRQKKREKYATLEKQVQSSSSATASSTSPESISDHGSLDFASCLPNSGVALPQSFNTDNISTDIHKPVISAITSLDYSMDAFMDPLDLPQGLANDIDFTTEMPETVTQSFELYQPQVQAQTQPLMMLPMDDMFDVPLLKTLKAGATNASLLGCETLIWDPEACWIFPSPHVTNAPSNMQPTPAQLTIPHHPLFDILPWPQLRTKLICIFAMPEQLRPVGARDSMALLQCAYDIEDPSEGFRVNGEGTDSDDWEVGEAFFRNWTWALDRRIINTSNAWRQKRGQSRLSIKSA